jgi:hypothetical protein
MHRDAPRLETSLACAMLAVVVSTACTPFARESDTESTDSRPPPITQLVEPNPNTAARDLFYGVGGREQAPPKDAAFRFLERDESGVSTNLEVEDPSGRVWDAKLGKEVKPEIAASRLLWAIGFHQPAVYYVREWRIADGPETGVQPEARFRLERPDWKKGGEWAWRDNPFVGTRELRGLVVMMAMINNWDLKTSNNKIYERSQGSPSRLYVVKDLGDSFGRSVRFFLGTQNDPADFSREDLIREVDGDRVDLHYRPVILNWNVDEDITVDDVLWTCRRLDRLSDRQWRDAFRAAGYTDEEGAAFISQLRRKVAEGLALRDGVRS